MPVVQFIRQAVSVQDPTTAFGEILTAELTPVIQIGTIYNINTRQFNTSTDGVSGSVTHANNHAVLQTGAAAGGWAKLQTRRFIKYRQGQGALGRFTFVPTAGVAGSEQYVIVGDDTNGLGFGYNGTSFGILILRAGTPTWIPQSEWNVDKMDGRGPSTMYLRPTFGNVYQVKFQHLGYGAQFFYVEDDRQGNFQLVHIRDYAGKNTLTSFTNPSVPITALARNTTNDTNITLRVPSVAAFVEGKIVYLGPKNAVGHTKTGIDATFTNLVTIKNAATFQGVTNRVPVIIDTLSFATSGTKPARFQAILNTTLGGTPSYTAVDASNSVMSYDIAGTTVTGGSTPIDLTIGKDGNIVLPGDQIGITLFPGDTLTIAAAATAGTADATATVGWTEDF